MVRNSQWESKTPFPTATTNDPTQLLVPAWEAPVGQRMGPGEVGRAAGPGWEQAAGDKDQRKTTSLAKARMAPP